MLEHLEHEMLGGAGLARVPSLPVTISYIRKLDFGIS
jgi:hypothetical protein